LSGTKALKKGEVLFREGDPSDAMYVIKTGRIVITKAKGDAEISLAELGPGDMLGEMAFFDNKPRSAGARAIMDSQIIILPFKALNAQFKTFPEWIKAIVRSVNSHLRNANMKIKMLEKSTDDDLVFPPYTMTRLCAILAMVAERYGEKNETGHLVPASILRNYTIQIFHQPTAKMQTFMEVLCELGHMKMEDLGEGRQRITIFQLDQLFKFVDYYNDYLFKEESKRVTIDEKEIKPLKAIGFYGSKAIPDPKTGALKINLTQMQADAEKDLGFPFSVDDVDSLIEKKLLSVKMTVDGFIFVTYKAEDLKNLDFIWEIVYALKKIVRI
jgi:CRP/FNR family cyclic AMP-dependent transcriptional regulator